MSPARYALVLGCFGFQRFLELCYSRANEARLKQVEPAAPVAAPSTFKWMVFVHAGLFTFPLIENSRRRGRHVPQVAQALGWIGTIAAMVLRFWVILTLREHWNVRAVVPRRLEVVDSGPYRWIRHPNYVAVGLEFAALPLIGGAYLSAAGLSVLNAIVLWDRVGAEEALLDALPQYRERMAGKPRFVPRWTEIRRLRREPATRAASGG